MSTDQDFACRNGHAVPTTAYFCPICATPLQQGDLRPDGNLPTGVTVPNGEHVEVTRVEEHSTETEPTQPSGLTSYAHMHAANPNEDQGESPGHHAPPTTPDAKQNQTIKPPQRRRRILITGLCAFVLAMVAGTTSWWFLLRETDQDRYLAALSAGGFTDQFATPDVALASGQAFCTNLRNGKPTEGYDYEKVAVDELCTEFAAAFTVIPTPAQQAQILTEKLRDNDLGGKFASDAAAVAHAEAVCRSLDDGAAQQGPEADAIAVEVYCAKYSNGFKTLYPIKVKGSFSLTDDDPSSWFPSITGSTNNCTGTGGYDDIGYGTEVVIKNAAGDVLTTTQLGKGRGIPPFLCRFSFKFTVMDGEKGGYLVSVSHRGETHYTAANLKMPNGVRLSLG